MAAALPACAPRTIVAAPWRSGREVAQERGKRVLSGSEEDRVRVRCRLVRQRRDVQAAEQRRRTPRAIVVRDLVRSIRVGDVDLNDDQVGRSSRSSLSTCSSSMMTSSSAEVRGERRQAKRRKEGVLDGMLRWSRRSTSDGRISLTRMWTLYYKAFLASRIFS